MGKKKRRHFLRSAVTQEHRSRGPPQSSLVQKQEESSSERCVISVLGYQRQRAIVHGPAHFSCVIDVGCDVDYCLWLVSRRLLRIELVVCSILTFMTRKIVQMVCFNVTPKFIFLPEINGGRKSARRALRSSPELNAAILERSLSVFSAMDVSF